MSVVLPVVQLGALDIGVDLGRGAVGTVSRLRQPPVGFTGKLVFKRYLPGAREQVDEAILRRFIAFPDTLSTADTELMRERLAWPLAAVYQTPGVVSGFLMSEIPSHYTLDIRGPKAAPAGVEFLLNGPVYERRLGITVDRTARLCLLLDLGRLLVRLHELGVVVGDLSPKNVLFSLAGPISCFLIDCDSMGVQGAHLLPPLETPGWEVPSGEDPLTRASDSYKFTLLAMRLFAGDQNTRDPQALSEVSPKLGRLATATARDRLEARPRISEWLAPLEAAVEASGRAADRVLLSPTATGRRRVAATAPPPRPKTPHFPGPSGPPSPQFEPRARLLLFAALVVVTLVLLSFTQTR
ncbi:hypothetical protein OG381_48545 (plasmid) [Streptomyces sp. NBC_00490]|uniref:hypothetical protein n=1 Tax=Streptomyces sp. NBC_00490 TaxID=2903657 RepID=UPI002E19A03B